MIGVIRNARTAHRRNVKVNPVEKLYSEPDEPKYAKYNCPVCTSVGNTGVSLPYGTERCPLCGVFLNWNRKIEVGDTVKVRQRDGFMCDTPIVESVGKEYVRVRSNVNNMDYYVKKKHVTVLEEVGE